MTSSTTAPGCWPPANRPEPTTPMDGTATGERDRSIGLLGRPPGARWPDPKAEADPNPFVAFRSLLWSHHAALATGWTDDRFVDEVRRLDDAVGEVDGRGFRTTPLRCLDDLATAIGQDGGLWAKDETGAVSGSHKARHLFGLALHLAVDGVPVDTPLAISSCGNAALGAAVVARAASRPLVVHVPTWADPVVLDRLSDLGADVRTCKRRNGESGDPCILRFRELVSEGALAFGCQGTDNLLTLDGGRTLGFELAAAWSGSELTPDRLFVQVGGGALASSTAQALDDAVALGGLERRPPLIAVQAAGCAPLARAFNLVSEAVDPMAALADPEGAAMWAWDDPSSAATAILDDVAYDWRSVVHDMLLGTVPGGPVVAPEEDVVEAYRLVAAHSPVPADATGTAGLAGLLAARRDECIGADEAVTVLLTGVERS